MSPEYRKVVEQMTQALADEKKTVEAGWLAFKKCIYGGKYLPPKQERECRLAFFAGASYVFQSILWMMESGEEPTPNDLKRMDNIHQELSAFELDWEAERKSRMH